MHKSIIHYSLFAMLIGGTLHPADAAVRVQQKSRTYADAYKEINMMRAQAEYEQQQEAERAAIMESDPGAVLAVRVANPDLAAKIARGDEGVVTNERLQQCADYLPNGQMEWAVPTAGLGAGGASTCVSVVELKSTQKDEAGQDIVAARIYLAPGQTFRCNISDFPEVSYLPGAEKVTFPADAEPTREDVERVMNEEQKQHAGLKIAAGTILGGLGGNIMGKAENGSDKMLGGGKAKTQSTIIGALSGAALMAASSYSGKTAGDAIMSAGVNAAAGGLVGNVMAANGSVLRIEECKSSNPDNSEIKEGSCLWGIITERNMLKLEDDQQDSNGKALVGEVQTAYFNISDGMTSLVCDKDSKNCKKTSLVGIKIEGGEDIEKLRLQNFESLKACTGSPACYNFDEKNMEIKGGKVNDTSIYIKITSAGTPTRRIPAAIVGVDDKAFGWTRAAWNEELEKVGKKDLYQKMLYGRDSQNKLIVLTSNYTLDDFEPMMLDADDGGIIDMDNKARMKSTVTGAGVGGALGAFTAYQGAKDEIENRWVAATMEYKDSLTKFYCMTGTRYLAKYNDKIELLPMTNDAE